ncbi:MAG: undecaprenyl-phosphate glucose phosphotransferase [Prevotella sp.]|nr:undecaprenyl-phosphate glucose phosphotransferase [Prevotella sp.]
MRQAGYRGNDLIKLVTTLGDFVLLNILVYLCLRVFSDYTPTFFLKHSKVVFLSANIAMVVAEYFFVTIIHYRKLDIFNVMKRVFCLVATQTALMFFFMRVISEGGGFFRFMLFFAVLLLVVLIVARLLERLFVLYLRTHGHNSQTVLFIGNDPANLMLYQDMSEEVTSGYVFRGYFADEPIENCPEQLTHLGNFAVLEQMLAGEAPHGFGPVDVVFCCLSHDEADLITRIEHYCDAHVAHFYYVPRMQGNLRLSLVPERYGDVMLFTNRREPLMYFSNRMLKRGFDIVVSALVCLVLIPFLPIVALIIKMQSPGPLFFTQMRTGLNGRDFKCYKFRSMHVNKQADSLQATKDDPRKFPFGELMRKTNIDEFPQFFNVLKGDMSIVGPRPHMMLHTEMYSKLVDKYMVRHFCRPGITGWAQVTGFRGETRELWQMEERIKRDIWYIENWSFWLDIKIILKTALSIFIPNKNAY